jgi:hypothetical protein
MLRARVIPFPTVKRVLFDHNVPSPLRRLLKMCDVAFADEMGWALLENGE